MRIRVVALAVVLSLAACRQPGPPPVPDQPTEALALQALPTAVATVASVPEAPAPSPTAIPSTPAIEPPVAAPATPPRVVVATHVVEPGDTLRAIAERFDTTVPALLDVNELPDPDLLSVGQELSI